MKVTSLIFRFFPIIVTSCGLAANAVDHHVSITLDPEIITTVKGWGLTPMALDWEGRIVLRGEAEENTRDLYAELKPDMIRILLGASNVYENERQRLRPKAIEEAIIPLVAMGSKASIKGYVLTILSPPAYMKTTYMTEGLSAMNGNGLRKECEGLFIDYVVEIIKTLREREAELPAALSFQSQPDLPPSSYGVPPTIATGAKYELAQWRDVGLLLRKRLDETGFSSVSLIGPECYGIDWIVESSVGARTSQTTWPFIAGVAYVSSGVQSGRESYSQDLEKRINDFNGIRGGRDVWMLASNGGLARNDAECIVNAAQEICNDFGYWRANYWFWRYGFAWEDGPNTLVVGREGKQTAVFRFLKKLWHDAPAGAVVRRVRFTPGEWWRDGLVGVAFETPETRVYLLVNDTGEVKTANTDENKGRFISAVIFPESEHARTVVDDGTAGSGIVVLPPHAAAIVVFRRKE